MSFNNVDKNANILRNVVDSSTQSNFALISSLSRAIPSVLDEESCRTKLGDIVDTKRGMELLQRKNHLNNLDIAYIIILVTRGYRFREYRNEVYLCEEDGISPIFQKLPSFKPKLSRSYGIKSMILLSLLESLEKDDDYILRTLIRTVPEFLERAHGVNYTGRYLSINEWLNIKEQEPNAQWEENEDGGFLKLKNISLVPWVFANLIILQIRGYFLQEIPSVAGSTYTFLKRTYP
ncbi:MAG: hypothetical protein ACTSQE_12990 [Candidatus Heimdallarchaeaceae archaeon]